VSPPRSYQALLRGAEPQQRAGWVDGVSLDGFFGGSVAGRPDGDGHRPRARGWPAGGSRLPLWSALWAHHGASQNADPRRWPPSRISSAVSAWPKMRSESEPVSILM